MKDAGPLVILLVVIGFFAILAALQGNFTPLVGLLIGAGMFGGAAFMGSKHG